MIFLGGDLHLGVYASSVSGEYLLCKGNRLLYPGDSSLFIMFPYTVSLFYLL